MLTLLGLAAQLVAATPPTTSIPTDTPPPSQRPRAVEVSDWYNRRLTIHRALSYATLPLFAFQYAAGSRLYEHGDAAPDWVRPAHRIGAATIAGVFTVNTVTGVWNLWDSRHVQQGRTRRYLHAASMLIADAGFTWAGAKLSKEAETSLEKRKLHRSVALASIGISVTSGVLMKIFND